MSTEQNKAIARRSIEELWNDRNAEVIDELFAEDYHDPAMRRSRRSWKEQVIAMFAAGPPPDMHITIEDQIAEGDKVVTRWTMKLYAQRAVPRRRPDRQAHLIYWHQHLPPGRWQDRRGLVQQ